MSEAQKQRPHELLWILWFDGKSISNARIFLPPLAALKSEISSWRKKIHRAKHSCVELFLNKFTGTILKKTNLILHFLTTILEPAYVIVHFCLGILWGISTTMYCIPETYLNKDNRKFVQSFHPILGFVLY